MYKYFPFEGVGQGGRKKQDGITCCGKEIRNVVENGERNIYMRQRGFLDGRLEFIPIKKNRLSDLDQDVNQLQKRINVLKVRDLVAANKVVRMVKKRNICISLEIWVVISLSLFCMILFFTSIWGSRLMKKIMMLSRILLLNVCCLVRLEEQNKPSNCRKQLCSRNSWSTSGTGHGSSPPSSLRWIPVRKLASESLGKFRIEYHYTSGDVY